MRTRIRIAKGFPAGLLALSSMALMSCGGAPQSVTDEATQRVAPTEQAEGSFSRQDGPVVVLPTGGGWVASQQVLISGDAAGASRYRTVLATELGDIAASARPVGGYQIEVNLEASGETEADARAALASMQIRHSDRGGSLRELHTAVVRSDYRGAPGDGLVDVELRRASITISLPASAAHDLQANSDLGQVAVNGLGGSRLLASSNLGDVQAAGQWDTTSLNSNLGDLIFSGTTNRLDAFTDLGSISGQVIPLAGADLQLQTNLGSIELALPSVTGAAFDLFAQTRLGTAVIAVAGTQPVGSPGGQQAHYRSPDFDASSMQVRVNAGSSLGSILIHD